MSWYSFSTLSKILQVFYLYNEEGGQCLTDGCSSTFSLTAIFIFYLYQQHLPPIFFNFSVIRFISLSAAQRDQTIMQHVLVNTN